MYRHGVEAVDKTIRYAILPAAYLRKDGKMIVQVENDLYNAFGYDEFTVQRRGPLHLPDGLDDIAELRRFRYVQVVVQMYGLLMDAWTGGKAKMLLLCSQISPACTSNFFSRTICPKW